MGVTARRMGAGDGRDGVRYFDPFCDSCKVPLEPVDSRTWVADHKEPDGGFFVDDGSWKTEGFWPANLKDALSIYLWGGYAEYIDPSDTAWMEGVKFVFCKACADTLFERYPAFKKTQEL